MCERERRKKKYRKGIRGIQGRKKKGGKGIARAFSASCPPPLLPVSCRGMGIRAAGVKIGCLKVLAATCTARREKEKRKRKKERERERERERTRRIW